MATGGPSNRYPDTGGELNSNQSAEISSGITEIKTYSTSSGPLILKIAKAAHRGGVAGQTCFSLLKNEIKNY